MHGRRSLGTLLAGIALAGILPLHGQTVITTGTRLVEVDVIVRDGKVPVLGLERGDFRLFDNGKEVKLASFAVNAAGSGRGTSSTRGFNGMVSNRVSANGERPVNPTIILLDPLNTAWGIQAQATARVLKLLASLEPGTPVALYSLGRQLDVIQDFTDDPAVLIAAARRLDGNGMPARGEAGATVAQEITRDGLQAEWSGQNTQDELPLLAGLLKGEVVDRTNRAAITAKALQTIARRGAGIPGRKHLVWVSSSLPLVVQNPNATAGDRVSFVGDLESTAQMLAEANVAVYTVDARGLAGLDTIDGLTGEQVLMRMSLGAKMGAGPPGVDTMNLLADRTGGKAFYNDNGIDNGVREAMEDGAVTYSLTFSPDADSLDDRFHKLKVELNRRGVDVRHRSGYFAGRDRTMTTPAVPPSVEELLGAALDATGIGLMGRVSAVPGLPGQYSLSARVDPRDLNLARRADGAWTGSMLLAFTVEGAGGQATSADIPVRLTPAEFEGALREGISLEFEFAVQSAAKPPERVRLLIQDQATGIAGTLRIPIP